MSSSKIIYNYDLYDLDFLDVKNKEFDHVVGVYRGSLGLATHISNVCSVPMSIVGFQTRDGDDKEPYWMHNAITTRNWKSEKIIEGSDGMRILVVDDIYDTGLTMRKVMEFVSFARTKPSVMPSVLGYCIFGKENDAGVIFSRENNGQWVEFPWER